MPYEFLPQDESKMKIKVTGGTRAGLMIAALHGMFAVASSKTHESEDGRKERAFAVKAASFPELIAAFLNEAIRLSDEHNEVYDDVRFELATDKEARGLLSGKPAVRFGTPVSAVITEGLDAARNAENQWETIIGFKGA